MKSKIFKMFGKSALPAMLAGAVLMLMSPVGAMAARGGGKSCGRATSAPVPAPPSGAAARTRERSPPIDGQ